MKACLIRVVLSAVLFVGSAHCEDQQTWSIDGGSLHLELSAGLLLQLGIEHAGKVDPKGDVGIDLPIGPQGNLEFLTTGGGFEKFRPGSLPVMAAPRWRWAGGRFPNSGLRLVPGEDVPPSLYLQDEKGGQWLRLNHGHYVVHDDALEVKVMDARLGPAFASALGNPLLTDAFIGGAHLISQVNRQAPMDQAKGGVANWPTVAPFTVDIAMLKMDDVNQVAGIFAGRVPIAPSAEFENIGTGDAPWFNMFTLPSTEINCIDDTTGACEPYGTDQGGILVYAFYRLMNGRLDQIGLSAAKHAFNSVNFNTALSLPCRFTGSARVVWSGCEDVYSAVTNAGQDFLGPRSEITAHTGEWARVGSVFDGDNDGLCDPAFNLSPFFGGIRCRIPILNPLDRRLHVAEDQLALEGARYFMESWYVVRDDVNIFNSMGYREVSPVLTSLWLFPPTQGTSFQPGSVLTEWVDDDTVVPGESSALLNTFEGRVRTAMRAEPLAGSRYRYRIAVMNHDFDRQIDSLSLFLPLGAQITATEHFDGDPDADTSNAWQASVSASELRWDAPAGQSIDWGVLHSFEFTSSLPPINASLTLGVAEAGMPESFDVSAVGLMDDVIHFDGFESQ